MTRTLPSSTLRLSKLALVALVGGCVRVDQAEFDARIDQDGDGDPAIAYGGEDCNDQDATVHSTAVERCNGADDDCNGVVDDTESAVTWYPDADGDGYGDPDQPLVVCDQAPSGHVQDASDCDDSDAAVSPDALEDCNGIDDDCNGQVDEVEPRTWYRDADGDGWGANSSGVEACLPPFEDAVERDGDCDDLAAEANPGVSSETCNDGLDNDCDGTHDGCGWDTDTTLEDAGRRLAGEGDSAVSGLALAAADLRGDGTSLVAVGAPGWGRYAGWEGDGGVLLVGDETTAGSGQLLLDQARVHLGGAEFTGGDIDPAAGAALAAGPDTDNDGFADLLIGAPGQGGTPGGAFLLRGPITASGNLTPSAVDLWMPGVPLSSSFTADEAGAAVAMGDVTGNGAVDLIVGAPGHGETGADHAGVVYVMGAVGSGERALNGGDRLRWLEADGEVGAALAVADIDGDGVGDVFIGAPGVPVAGAGDAGTVFFVHGPIESNVLLDSADAAVRTGGYLDRFGARLANVGDVDDDGLDDVLAAAPFRTAGVHVRGGQAYLFSEAPAGSTSADDAAAARFDGRAESDLLGVGLAGAGDVDADGTADLLIGAPTESQAGAAWLVHGPVGAGVQDLASVGVRFDGAVAKEQAGAAVVGAGDLDGDGLDDFAVGSPGLTPAGGDNTAGAVTLVGGFGF